MKKKVKFMESWAHLADPDDKALDAKYKGILDACINGVREEDHPKALAYARRRIKDMKESDRYGQKPVGFPRDVRFKSGDEALLNADLAEKLADGGLVMIFDDGKK